MNKLDIFYEMKQFDLKNRSFYSQLTDEERKKFSNFLMIRWGSAVGGSPELQSYYLMSCNDRLNKNWFDLNKHPELQWLLATTVSPGMGTHRHEWIKQKKRESNNKVVKFLRNFYPDYADDDLETLAELTTKDELKQLAKQHGWDDKRIKSEL
jgi:hypothetical protein